MSEKPGTSDTPRRGRWLPGQDRLEEWLEGLVDDVDFEPGAPLHPAVERLRELIDRDPIARLELTMMIDQVPHTKPYKKRHIKSLEHLLALIDHIIRRAPEYHEKGPVGLPLNAALDWCMGTHAGMAAFRRDSINAAFREILRAWCDYLCSPASLDVLNTSPRGWMSEHAREFMQIEQYQHKPRAKHWGFTSWNDFFIRQFKPGLRPVAEPDDPKTIVAACESTPYAISRSAKVQDQFWIKDEPYSLRDMLADDDSAPMFDGGTVFQAFLDVYNYHRWHSPVSGTIHKAFVKEGTYYSESEAEGEDPDAPEKSQGYLAHVATRAIYLIDADDPAIGRMAAVFIGMGEVSSCVIPPTMTPGRRVEKGEEIGYFQFGGSTHCLVFRPGAIAEFSLNALPDPHTHKVPLLLLNSKLARAR